MLFQVCRLEPKSFRQRRPDGKGGFIWGLKDARRVLFNLPAVVAAQTVVIVEGERDVENLGKFVPGGSATTCNPMGAGKWRDAYVEHLRGKTCFILPDNDKPGREHAATVAKSLVRVAETYIIDLPPERNGRAVKDASDWLEAGGTWDELLRVSEPKHMRTQKEITAWFEQSEKAKAAEPAGTTPEDEGAAEDSEQSERQGCFALTTRAVMYEDPDRGESTVICSRVEVLAKTRSSDSESWGRLLEWPDDDRIVHRWPMPMEALQGDALEVLRRLSAGGLRIAPGSKARNRLLEYLGSWQTDTRVRCVNRIGWHGHTFALPDETFSPDQAETVLYQSPYDVETLYAVSGTTTEWRAPVGERCVGNSRLILSASMGFVGPCLSLIGGESGGVHLVGSTSSGKSTALTVGGSVLGGGGRNGFCRTWRATANGLEAVAELHSDTTLFIDELAQVRPEEASEIAYLLANGMGKLRMSKNIGARRMLNWSLIFLSAGEVSLADHAQTVGKRSKGGVETRLLNVDADSGCGLGLFEDLHGAESAEVFSRQIKECARRFYGSPIREFLRYVVDNRAEVESYLRSIHAEFLATHVPPGAAGEVSRAGARFAAIGAAGELASSIGITGWPVGEAIAAAGKCFRNWLDQRGTRGSIDEDRAIRQVRMFLEQHGASRFQSYQPQYGPGGNQITERVFNRAGFKRETTEGDTEFFVLKEVFRNELCAGFDYRMVASALERCGALDRQPPECTKIVRLPELGRVRVFAVKASALLGDERPEGGAK